MIRAIIRLLGACILVAIFIVCILRAQEAYHYTLEQEAYQKGYIDGGQFGFELGLRECNPGVYSPQAEDESVATPLDT